MKRCFLLFLALFSSVQSAAGSLDWTADFVFRHATGIQLRDWKVKENWKTVFLPQAGISVLEGLVLKKTDLSREIVGSDKDFNTKTTIALFFCVKLLYHVVPVFMRGGSLADGCKSFFQSGQFALCCLLLSQMIPGEGKIPKKDERVRIAVLVAGLATIIWRAYAIQRVLTRLDEEIKTLNKELHLPLKHRSYVFDGSDRDQDLVLVPRLELQSLFHGWFNFWTTRECYKRHFEEEVCKYGLLNWLLDYENYKTRVLNENFFEPLSRIYLEGKGAALLLRSLTSLFFTVVSKITGSPAIFKQKFIRRDLFDLLSWDLQEQITLLNEQDLLINAHNLFGGYYSQGLVDYTQEWYYQDNPKEINSCARYFAVNRDGSYSPEIKTLSNKELLARFRDGEIKYKGTVDRRYWNTFFDVAGSFVNISDINPNENYNVMEQSLRAFLAFADGYDARMRNTARVFARKVLQVKPKSYLAHKTLSVVSRLEAQEPVAATPAL
ncbi:hypothetical protein FJ366_01915 [Candidatus Dependentiae bacterium]|nr:hypothetical protein [Candidatus Dependentiae bacterium]